MLGGTPRGRQLAIYVPSRDKNGNSIDHVHWAKVTMEFMTQLFGRCTAMPRLQGIWADEEGKVLDETTDIVFSYVEEQKLAEHAGVVHEFLIEMGKATRQAEVGYAYDGEFYTIPL